jgi:signal transduction histidine kinase
MKKPKKYSRDSAKFRAALNYRKINKPVEAKKLILEMLNDQPDFAPALSEMGEILTLEKDYDKAIFYFNKKLDVLPDDQSALKNKGVMHRLKGRIGDAIGGFEKGPALSRHKLKKELRKKDAQLIAATEIATANALLTSFAHQVNNPLQIIQSIIYRLQNKKRLVEDDMRKGLDKIQDNANRIHDLIKNQNKLVRNSSEDNEYFNVVEVIIKAFEPFEEQLNNHGIKKNLTNLGSNDSAFWIFGNPIKVEELFINLIANARDALDSVKQPEIIVKAIQPNKNDIVIHFTDNGKGISKENLKRIFNSPFTTKQRGTGLGLLLCYSVINQMGGKIKVRSQLGKGTKFIITLPNKGGEYGKT